MGYKNAIELISDIDKNIYNSERYLNISMDIFEKINSKIPASCGNQRTLLLWLVSQKQNTSFSPSEQLILKSCAMTHSAYVKARAELHKKGFIEYVPYRYIKIIYKQILN